MKITIDGSVFDYEIGSRILKTKYGHKPFKGLEEVWDKITPLTLQDICLYPMKPDLRRKSVIFLGPGFIDNSDHLRRLHSEFVDKHQTHLNEDGRPVIKYNRDWLELVQFDGRVFFQTSEPPDRFSDPKGYYEWLAQSEDEYSWLQHDLFYVRNFMSESGQFLYRWVDMYRMLKPELSDIRAVDAMAFTLTPRVPYDEITDIIVMGDMSFYKMTDHSKIDWDWDYRPLKGYEYLNGIIHES